MKIMVVGNYNWDIYEAALCNGLEELGVNVVKCKISSISFFKKATLSQVVASEDILRRTVLAHRPDVLFLYRVNEVRGNFLKRLKQEFPKMKVVAYHNDNPYLGLKRKLKYRWYLSCIFELDLVFVFRPGDLESVRKMTEGRVIVLMPYYDSRAGFGKKIELETKIGDMVFIGHYEPNREKSILELLKAGVRVDVYCSNWPLKSELNRCFPEVIKQSVYGNSYRDVLASYKLGLCFLSRQNRDVYTRRTFEIPAAGCGLVSEYTFESAKLFREGKEAIFFRNNDELVEKTTVALKDGVGWRRLAHAGWERVSRDGHSEVDRAKQIISSLEGL